MSELEFEFCKAHRMYDLGGYVHCRVTKKGQYVPYEGSYGDTRSGRCDTVELRVIRDEQGKPLRFETVEGCYAYVKNKGLVP